MVLLMPLVAATIARESLQIPLPKDGRQEMLRPSRSVRMRYLVSLPEGYAEDRHRKWPLIFFLHGAGERGEDVNKVRIHGPLKEVGKGRKLPFVIVAPQCPENQVWDIEALRTLLDRVEKRYRIDLDREYLTGLSMGGFGTWDLAAELPGRFAAIAPVCGGGSWIKAWMLAKTPVWAVHGDADPVVPIDESRRMVERLRALGDPEVKFTVVPGGGHDVWSEFYGCSELYDWFLQHRRIPQP